jgi:hypothetical protein
MLFKRNALFYILLSLTLFASSAASQTSATLTGRVLDEQRSAVTGAAVEATNLATNTTATAATNEDGRYTFSELKPGNYRLAVRQSGFQTTVKENVVLNVTARANEDFVLRVGEVTATVTVENSSAIVERDSPAVSTVITREFVENIPLNGRSFQSLLELTPGVILTPSTITNPGQLSVNGQRTNSNYSLLTV